MWNPSINLALMVVVDLKQQLHFYELDKNNPPHQKNSKMWHFFAWEMTLLILIDQSQWLFQDIPEMTVSVSDLLKILAHFLTFTQTHEFSTGASLGIFIPNSSLSSSSITVSADVSWILSCSSVSVELSTGDGRLFFGGPLPKDFRLTLYFVDLELFFLFIVFASFSSSSCAFQIFISL